MPSRRAALQAGSAALLAALAGCQRVPGDSAPTTEGSTDDPTTSKPDSSTTPGEPTLSTTVVDASDVESGATAAVSTPELHALVADAASADGRVDLQGSWGADGERDLALGQFEYLEFQGETYEATGSYAGFAGEANYQYSLEAANESEIDGDVLEYADLNGSERAAVDEMLANDSYSAGHHEEKPDIFDPIEQHRYLRAENQTYRIRMLVGDHAGHYMLRLDAAEPDEGAQVVTVADREPPQAAHDVVQATRLAGDAPLGDEEALMSFFERVDYVVTATAVVAVDVIGGGTTE